MSNPTDYFSLFRLPARFALDREALSNAYRAVQNHVHPDRFAAASAAEKRVAMQWSAHANAGYETLRSPRQRAAYLCEMHGAAIHAETNTAMAPAFLAQQMQWREALDEARRTADRQGLDDLARALDQAQDQALRQLECSIDEQADYPAAAAQVRELMFLEKFRQEIEADLARAENREHG